MKGEAIDFNVVTVSCGDKHPHLKWSVSRNGINDGDDEARQIRDGGKKLAGVNQVAAARRIETGWVRVNESFESQPLLIELFQQIVKRGCVRRISGRCAFSLFVKIKIGDGVVFRISDRK